MLLYAASLTAAGIVGPYPGPLGPLPGPFHAPFPGPLPVAYASAPAAPPLAYAKYAPSAPIYPDSIPKYTFGYSVQVKSS